MYLRLYRSSWETLLQLQEAFENGTLLKSRIEILDCSANDDSFCHVPTIEAATSGPYRLRLQVTHLDIEDTSILFAYKIIYRQLGSPSWNVKISRRSLFSPRINLIMSFLKPYRNYTVRVFPYSLLGDRLGSKLRMFQTTEKGEQGVFLNCIIQS
ncbi:uncharacterized protein LOC110063125 [Orbicella faveolata]|uniref:uncharacterized protein LOC110063125 n=1 Tax=Orbicella faveolata TaxID=48498 RepID=UPI0009E4D6E9|nr:uncharacterized protein LOC110063125 [Orbicella faveolata]